MTKLYMGGEDLPDDYIDENGVSYEIKDGTVGQIKYTTGQKEDVQKALDGERGIPDDTSNEHDKTYENESTRDYSPMVQISVKEYDRLKEQGKYITDPTLIGMIDKMEFFLKELRKHIVRKL